MPKLNLGRVVGRDGGFGNTDTVYINDGGAPSVTVEASGEDTAKDFVFTFKNLVRDVATADEVEQIAAGEIVQSSNVITAGVMSSIWAKIKGAFATKSHTHDASDITAGELAAILIANGLIDTDMLAAGAVTTTKIADGAVTKDKLEKSLGDSLSRGIKVLPQTGSGNFEASSFNLRIASNAIEFQFPIKGSDFSFYSLAFLFSGSILIYRRSRAYPDTPDETLLRLA